MKRGITLGTVFAGSALCLLGTKVIVDHVFSVELYSCKFDSIISDSHRNEIFDFINTHKYLRTISLDNLFFVIKDRFKIVKSIKAYQSGQRVLQLDIQAVRPQFIVNENYVMSQKGLLFDKKLFDKNLFEYCKRVTVKQFGLANLSVSGKTSEFPTFCKEIIYSLPQDSFEQYDIVLEIETKNYMHDKLNKNFSILFNRLYVPDEKILCACNQLKHKLEDENRCKSKQVKRWYADVRFKNQIVLYQRGR